MIVLGLDTATADTAVGLDLGDGSTARTARDVPAPGARPGHVERILPLAVDLLDAAGLRLADVDLVAVGTGPGSFTGLRIGVATAKALAYGAGAGLAGVPSTAVLAAGSGEERVVACLDARRGEVFAAAWSAGAAAAAAGADASAGPLACAPPDVTARIGASGGGFIAVGDGAVRHRDALVATGLAVPPDDDPRHRVDGAVLCALGALAGPAPDPAALGPDYVRAPDAVPTAVREAMR